MACRSPRFSTTRPRLPPDLAEHLLAAAADLGAESLSHGSIDPDHVVLAPDGTVVLDDFLRGTSSASPQRAARDLASAVTCAALVAGPDEALTAARHAVGDAAVLGALPFLQGGALPSSLASEVKNRRPELLATLRTEGASRLGVDPPELAKLTRVSVTTLILAVGTLIGGWALIGVLLNVANSFDTSEVRTSCGSPRSRSSPRAPTRRPPPAARGRSPAPCRTASSSSWSCRTRSRGSPSAPSRCLGARVRFFQKQGIDATTAVSSGVARLDGQLDREGRALRCSRCPSPGARSTWPPPRPTPRGAARRSSSCSS